MAILIDSNVLIDVVTEDPVWCEWSKRRLVECARQDDLLVNVIIIAEVAHGYRTSGGFETAMEVSALGFDHIPREAGFRAGDAHRDYRERGGSRERTLPDFLIGAHAEISGHRLLTRDPTRYRTYFPVVDLIAPDTHP